MASMSELQLQQQTARFADHIKAQEMESFVINAVVTRSLGLSEPIYKIENNRMTFVAQDFQFDGETRIRLSEDGRVALINPDGTPAKLNLRA